MSHPLDGLKLRLWIDHARFYPPLASGAVSLMVMIPAFQAGGPGSIPGRRIFGFVQKAFKIMGLYGLPL